jgi:two-component system, NarL family, nitrate/nitrite response regulator NarL
MSSVAPIRIVLVDDHAVFRDGLRKLLESEPGLQVCGEAGDATGAMEVLREQKPDILLLDMAMPGTSGLEVLRLLEDEPFQTRVLVLTASVGRSEGVQALQLGARGLVLKTVASGELFESIRAVMADDFWVGSMRLPDMETGLRQLLGHARRHAGDFNLTPREREILAALVEGSSNRDLADRFQVSEVTIKHHLKSIFDKCGTSSRLELVLFALRHGLARL